MTTASPADIRTWAQEHGHPAGDRGRLPAGTVAAYEAAHGLEGSATEAGAAKAKPKAKFTKKAPARKTTGRRTGGRKTATAKAASGRSRSARATTEPDELETMYAAPDAGQVPAAVEEAVVETVEAVEAAPATERATAKAARKTVPGDSNGAGELAGALRGLLDSINAEVGAVNELTDRIDALVTELNDVRADQARRLLTLDALRGATTDRSLGKFLEQTVEVRLPQVEEVVPDRLS